MKAQWVCEGILYYEIVTFRWDESNRLGDGKNVAAFESNPRDIRRASRSSTSVAASSGIGVVTSTRRKASRTLISNGRNAAGLHPRAVMALLTRAARLSLSESCSTICSEDATC